MLNSKLNLKRGALASAVALMLIAGAATAKDHGGKRHGGMGFNLERMADKLELSESQVTQIQQLIDTTRPEKGSMKARKAQMKELIEQGNVDQAAELAAEAARQRVYNRTNFKNGLSQILTAEQLAQMEEFKERRKERRERRKERKGGREGAESDS